MEEDLDYDNEFKEYEEELESFVDMVVQFEKLSPIITTIVTNKHISINNVASLESIVPGMLTDDYDINSVGGIFSPEAYSVALEQTINTEVDMVMMLMSKFFKLSFRASKLLAKSSVKLAGVVSALVDDKTINNNRAIISTSIEGAHKLQTVNFSKLNDTDKSKITKLVSKYTGSDSIGESEVVKVVEAVKSSKNGIEIMSKVYMPRYSNILLPMFFIPTGYFNTITKFFKYMDETVLPSVDTNLNTAIMELNNIMSTRDWVALSKFDTVIFSGDYKHQMFVLADAVKADVSSKQNFRKVSAKTYAGLSELLRPSKKGLTNNPKYNHSLLQCVKDVESMKDHILSISDTMSDMSKHGDSRTATLSKDLKRFRASKTVKESLNGTRQINRYSNAVYSRIMREMKEVAILSSFMAQSGRDVLNAYTGIYTRSNKLNNNTVKFIEQYNKILGES